MSPQDISGICRGCLATNVKIFNITHSRLQALYKNIICTGYEFDFALDLAEDFGLCYICYAQLLKLHKFSELAQTSVTRLQYFIDRGMVMVSIRSSDLNNLHKQHNLSITDIPPVSTLNNSNTNNEQIKHENGTSENCEEFSSCDIEKPTLKMISLIQDNNQTQSPIQSKSIIETAGTREGIARSIPICKEYVTSNSTPVVGVKEEYFEHKYNISVNCELFNNCDEEQPMLSCEIDPQDTIDRSQSLMQTNLIDLTNISEECAFSKPVADLNVSHPISFQEGCIKHEQNSSDNDDCEMTNKCDIEFPTLTMPQESNLIQSPMQTETFVGTKRTRGGCALSALIEQQREKVEVNEFRNDKAVANTTCPSKMLKRKNDMNENNVVQKDATIDELIQMLIKIHKGSIKTKKPNVTNQNNRWCNRSQELLILLITLAGSERAGATLLTERVFPLFPQGFMRLPTLATLLRMARNKKNKKAGNGERKNVNMHSSILRLAKAKASAVEAKLRNLNLLKRDEELSKLSQLNKTSTVTVKDLRENLPPKETEEIIKHQDPKLVLFISRKKSNNKEEQKLALNHKQSSEAQTRPSGSTISKDDRNTLEFMLNKLSKFKKKLDSQNNK